MPVQLYEYAKDTFVSVEDGGGYRAMRGDLAAKLFGGLYGSVTALHPAVGLSAGDLAKSPYTDYNPGGLRRYELTGLFGETLGAADRLLGDNPSGYALPFVREAVNLPESSTEYAVVDESVPFLQMVLHGLIPYGGRALNASGDPDKAFLECVALGSVPHYELLYQNQTKVILAEDVSSYYGADFSRWRDTVAACYTRYAALYEQTAGASITEYEMIAPGVSRTVYSNGVTVLVNRTETAAAADGFKVPALDFVVTGGAAS
jgi:hypothetical protein